MRSFVHWVQSLGYALKGASAIRRGDDDGVIRNYTRAIEISPEDLDYYHARGDAYWHKHELGLAAADFSKAIDLNPDDFYAHMRRGAIYRERGFLTQAIHEFDWVLDVEDLALAHYLRASCYAEEKEYDKALADLEEAMKTHPHSEKVLQLKEQCEHELEHQLEHEKENAS